MTSDETVPAPKLKRAATRRCPVRGHEALRIAYGMILTSMRKSMPKSEFAGCVMEVKVRANPATG